MKRSGISWVYGKARARSVQRGGRVGRKWYFGRELIRLDGKCIKDRGAHEDGLARAINNLGGIGLMLHHEPVRTLFSSRRREA